MKKCALAALIFCMGAFVLCGCGDSFDPAAYVKDALTILTTGETVADSQISEDEQKEFLEEYDEMLNDAAEEISNTLGVDSVDQSKEVLQAIISTIKYEVNEEFKDEGDGKYAVDITVYPQIFTEKVEKYCSGELTEKFTKKAGEYSSMDALQKDMMKDVLAYMKEIAAAPEYGDGVTKTIHVTNADGKVEVDEDEMEALMTNAYK